MTLSADSPRQSQPRVAVIGSGYWGANLARALHQLGALAVVCDKSEDVLAVFRDKLGVETSTSLASALARKDVAAAVVATPLETRFFLTRQALLAHKHVYVEKPMVQDVAEGQELARLAEAGGLLLHVGQPLRHHPGLRRVLELIRAGELGRLKLLRIQRSMPASERREQHPLWSFAPQDLAIAQALAEAAEPEARPRSVATWGRLDEFTSTQLRFSSKLLAVLEVSWLHAFEAYRLELAGEAATVVFEPGRAEGALSLHRAEGGEVEFMELPADEPLLLECKRFLRAVAGAAANAPRDVGGAAEWLRTLELLKHARHSLERGGQRLELDGQGRVRPPAGVRPTSGFECESGREFGREAGHGRRREWAEGVDVHETALVEEGAELAPGVVVGPFSRVLAGARLGEGATLEQNVLVGADARVGANCRLGHNVSVGPGVVLEDGVVCGPGAVVGEVDAMASGPGGALGSDSRAEPGDRPTLLRAGSRLGANSTVLAGVTLDRDCRVPAGSVAAGAARDHVPAGSAPAREP